MSRRPTPRPRRRPPGVGALETLARLVEEAAAVEGWHRPPIVVRVLETGRGGDGLELGFRTLDDVGHPLDALAGFEAPRQWKALGLVAEGTVQDLPTPGRSAGPAVPPGRAAAAAHHRVRVVHLVDRDATSATVLRVQGETPSSNRADGLTESSLGRLDDVVRRALGLPSTAPAERTVTLWALVWLDRLLTAFAATSGTSPRLGWPDAAGRHPAVELGCSRGSAAHHLAPADVARLGEMLGRAYDWSDLRRACGRGAWPVPELPAELARWMDDGIFSRWLTGAYPPLGDLFDAVNDLAPAATAAAVAATLRRWGLHRGTLF